MTCVSKYVLYYVSLRFHILYLAVNLFFFSLSSLLTIFILLMPSPLSLLSFLHLVCVCVFDNNIIIIIIIIIMIMIIIITIIIIIINGLSEWQSGTEHMKVGKLIN